MMQLFLRPTDVWLFRDGRPFDAFSDHRAASLFPPYPTVIQGAIRSHQLVLKHVPLHKRDRQTRQQIIDLVGTATDYGNLRIKGPFLARYENGHLTRYYPQPADAATVDKDTYRIQTASAPEPPAHSIKTNAETPYLIGLRDDPRKPVHGIWLREQDLFRYFDGEEVTGVPATDLFVRENRLGIGINDDSHTTEEGAIYEVEFIRPHEHVGLYLEIDGYDDWPDEGLMRIGGEGRGAYFQKIQVPPAALGCTNERLPERFKMYFATPTLFETGWEPTSWGKFFEGTVERKAAAVPRYESIGGYDVANNRHKAARRYVSSGSVYYFESKGPARLKETLEQDAITEFGAEIGFGQIIIQPW